MKAWFLTLFLFATPAAFAGELLIVRGSSSIPTPDGDQTKIREQVMKQAISSAKETIADTDLVQHSQWVTSWFMAGSRTYANASATFRKPNDNGPWNVEVSGTYEQVYNAEAEQIPAALARVKTSAQSKADFYCVNGASVPTVWNESIEPDSYNILVTIQASANFHCL